MSTFLQYFQSLKTFLKTLLTQIEESQTFERLVMRYESLDPYRQKQLREVSSVTILLSVIISFLWPLGHVFFQRNHISQVRELTSESRRIQTEFGVEKRPAPKPIGWQSLSASNAEEIENSINAYLNMVNLTTDQYTLSRRGGEDLKLDVPELNLRQFQMLLFQLDGWHPSLRILESKAESVGESKEKLSASFTLRFDPRNPFDGGTPMGTRGSGADFEPIPDAGTNGGSFEANLRPGSSSGGSGRNGSDRNNSGSQGFEIEENESDVPPPPPPTLSPDSMTFDDDEG